MAITWELKITPISIPEKTGSILATRTDDADPENPRTYTVPKTPFKTTAQKTAAWNEIRNKHLAVIAKETAISNFVSTLETQGKTYLEAQE